MTPIPTFLSGGLFLKPVIGITGNYDSRDEIGLLTHAGLACQDWEFLATDYFRTVREAGGVFPHDPPMRRP